MKLFVKYSSLAFAVALLGTGVIESASEVNQAHAAVVETQDQQAKVSTLVSEKKASNLINDFLKTANSQQIEEIQENIAASAQKESNGDTTTVSIDDQTVESAIMKVISPDTVIMSSDSNKGGTTKIIWYGSAMKGNVDIYLSAKMLNFAKQQGFNVLAQILFLLQHY
ncbi:hypothetical protein [uncultured Secundilactobacillus sp.]|uniref:hypothetical protein n=1 Tax=uncultured Secundilactobacillus sp. TaxID=2813935 RepID=UPI00258F8E0D|nr:hypothetical protein [uncultured Secundilactobacillus sp.]